MVSLSKELITQDLLNSLLIYCPTTGVVTNKVNKRKARAGDRAGTPHKNGSVYIRVLGTKYLAHRLIWLMVTGAWPKKDIDHMDHNRSNNRWENLREVTHVENMRNRSKSITNTTGVTGVSIDKRCGKYRAYINIDKKHTGLGYFTTLEAAVAAREAALKNRKEYHVNHGS